MGGGLAIALWQLSGPPSVPSPSDFGQLAGTLRGSTLSDAQLIAVGTAVAWMLLAYLALTATLRAILIAAVRATGGARWARTALRFSRLITIPAIRRMVDGGVAGVLLLSTSVALPARALAFTPTDSLVVLDQPVAGSAIGNGRAEPGRDAPQEHARTAIEYTVQRGDSLWEIARRFYGDGSRYVEIFEANRDREMPQAGRFVDPRSIDPGWVLSIPLPAQNLTVGEITTYRVIAGDDLWSIAARLLGDGFRWIEVFDANSGREMADGRRFNDPSLIYPGWLLELPRLTVQDTPGLAATATRMPIPASPTPAATSNVPMASDPAAEQGEWSWPTLPREVLVTAAGFVVLSGVALFVQRLRRSVSITLGRRRSAEPPIGDAGRVALAADALSSALGDLGFGAARILEVDESSRGLVCLIACSPADALAISEQREDIERRLACEVQLRGTANESIELVLNGFSRFAASVLLASTSPPALVVPVGANEDAIAYMNVAAGAVGVAVDAHEQRRLMRAWIATLTTTHAPDRLALRADASTAELIGDLIEAPHFVGVAGTQDATTLAEELDAIIQLRSSEEAERLPILALMSASPTSVARLHEVIRVGAAVGVFVVANVENADLALFPTTVRTADALDPDPDDADAAGALMLGMADTVERRLDPVQVRRDTSPRWRDSVGTDESDPERPPDPLPPPAEWSDEEERLTIEAQGDAVTPRSMSAECAPLDVDVPAGDGIATLSSLSAIARERDDHASAVEASTTTVALADRPPLPEIPSVQGGGAETPASAPVPTTGHSTPRTEGSSLGARQLAMFVPALDDDEPTVRPPFTVRCFGGFEVEVRGSRVTSWTYQKAAELLAFLVIQGSPISGERIAEALWPGVGWDSSLRHNLRNIAAVLRATLRDAAGRQDLRILESSRQSRLEFESHLFIVDIEEFEKSLRRAASAPSLEALDEYDHAFAQYRGEFLAGQALAWAESFRVEFRQRLLESTHRAAEIATHLGARERAFGYYRIALKHYPVDEVAARGYMRVLADSGDINGARKVYRVLSEAIQQELEDPRAGPDPETRALLAQLTEDAKQRA